MEGEFLCAGEADIGREHRLPDARVVALHAGLGQVLRANAVDDARLSKIRLGHQVVAVEHDGLSGRMHRLDRARERLVPWRPPYHQNIEIFDFF